MVLNRGVTEKVEKYQDIRHAGHREDRYNGGAQHVPPPVTIHGQLQIS
jgi:hypothetical protein